MHPIERDFTVYTFSNGSDGGSIIFVIGGFDNYNLAYDWLNENGNPKIYYTILENLRRQ